MKCLSVLLLAILPFIGFGQDLTEDQLKIYRANEVVFYGYDFSNFKLAEAKRMYDGNIKKIIPQVIEKTGEIITEKMLRSQLRKEEVTFNFDCVLSRINDIKEENLTCMFKHNIPIDSVQTIINQYNLKEKEGVGMVVIVECFEKAKESVSAYYVFFDIATKHVLMNTFKFVKSAGGTGLANHWGKGLGYAFNTYLYYDYSKFYRKAKKTIKSDAIQ